MTSCDSQSYICKCMYKIHVPKYQLCYNKQIKRDWLCFECSPQSSLLSSGFIFPFILYKQDHHLKHPFLPWLRLQICRWGIHSSSVATSSSNLHDTRVHNQEMQFSPYSYNNPGKSQKIDINSMHCVKERRYHFGQYIENRCKIRRHSKKTEHNS